MGRLRSLVLVALLLGGTFVLAGAGIDRDDSGRGMLGTPIDTFSTFEIGSLYNVYPTHTDTLPVYLHTDSLVTYIECHIYWKDNDLELDTVLAGPGIPIPATLNYSGPNDSTAVIEISYPNNPFEIPDGEPIAYLVFEVQCYGYGTQTPIKFTNNASENVFVCNGVLYSPFQRLDGVMWTAYEYNCSIYGETVPAYVGEQHITMPYYLDQAIPGKLLCVHFLYSSQDLHFDSVTVGDDLMPGDEVYAEENDTLKIMLPETNEFLMPGELNVFNLHFSLKVGTDPLTAYVVPKIAERLDECGGIKTPSKLYDIIYVPIHTATADLGDVSYYASAETYDVWVKMGSNNPINDYKLWIDFPEDTISFDTIVAYGDFTPPLAQLSGDSTKLVVTADDPTNYPPSAPTVVFKIRFDRLIYLPVGTVVPIKFYDSEQNHISYNMDDPFDWHKADMTLLDGKITIVSTPHNHCPTLFVWNGTAFEQENTILAECDGKVVENDVTDYYLVSRTVPIPDGALRFQIREDSEEISRFSDFRLLVVDHPRKRPIQVTREGEIITIGQPHSIIWAKDHKGNDITELIATKDAVPYMSTESGWFDVNFGKVSPEEIEGFAVLSIDKPKDPEIPDNLTATDLPRNTKLDVSMKLADGSWRLIAREDARLVPGSQATMIDPALVNPETDLVLRYSWDDYYKIDFLDFRTAEPFEGKPIELDLASADHSAAGEVRTMLGDKDMDAPVTLVRGEAIDLAFDISSLPPYSRNTKRDYIFIATGQYHKEGKEGTPRAEFALDANFPNPFNPVTTIRYNLPTSSYVELRIYDVRGALVRTLVTGHQAAGEKQVSWDGRLDSGLTAASGVYFYQLKTDSFKKTRKMILLR
ncbi:MAG TPA: FlgD immunoglobulin-like domain containing protein [Patescibacteria group bacterium]|nr:FlgD immunoglobulin-like domain containing protein [Patescibacteria group bacterium]